MLVLCQTFSFFSGVSFIIMKRRSRRKDKNHEKRILMRKNIYGASGRTAFSLFLKIEIYFLFWKSWGGFWLLFPCFMGLFWSWGLCASRVRIWLHIPYQAMVFFGFGFLVFVFAPFFPPIVCLSVQY